jgi:hypothetical protein
MTSYVSPTNPTCSLSDLDPDCDWANQGRLYYDLETMLLPCVLCEPVEGYGGCTAYAGNVKEAARRETCAETFYDAF